MKRPRHVCSTVSSFLALSVPIAALLAVVMPAAAGATTPSRWTVAADSGAVPPPPPAPVAAPPVAPAPAPADTAAKLPPPPAAPSSPAPAPADTAARPPAAPAPAPTDTTGGGAVPMVAPPDTTVAPAPVAVPPVVTPAPPPAPPPPPPLSPKQQRALEKQKQRDARLAARAAKHPKKAKKADVDPLAAWNKGKTWVTLRAGFATSTEPGSAGGAIGAGLGLQHFITSRWSLGLTGDGDLLGKFGAAAEIEYPVTMQLMRHFRWQTALRPYLGAGGGAYYHKFFRTGNDVAQWKGGSFLTAGANLPVTGRSILGLDARMAFVSGDPSAVNPVFGNQRAQLTHYTLKLGWSLAF